MLLYLILPKLFSINWLFVQIIGFDAQNPFHGNQKWSQTIKKDKIETFGFALWKIGETP